MEAKIGIYEPAINGIVQVHIFVGDLYFEFGADNKAVAMEVINALKDAKIVTNPNTDFWGY